MDRAAFLGLTGAALRGVSSIGSCERSSVPAEWLDVRAYGAVGDGKADDSSALQAAFDAAGSASDPTTVYAPPGRYSVASEIRVRRHGTVVHFDGELVPAADYAGYLLVLDGRRRHARRTTYGQGRIDIARLRIDGRHRSRGLRIEFVDNASLANILIERPGGTGLALRGVRESDLIALSIIEGSGVEPAISIDQARADGTNNVRFLGVNVVYGTGPAVRIDSHARTTSRSIVFVGAQIHYLDREREWGSPAARISLIQLRRCRSVSFVACNLRLGQSASGAVIELGHEDRTAEQTRFLGCMISGEGRGAVGIAAARAEGLTVLGCDFDMRSGTPMAGAASSATVFGAGAFSLPLTGAAPQAFPGMIVLADGNSWNPAGHAGGRPYLVRFDGFGWQAMSS